jgi:hypothetical protein
VSRDPVGIWGGNNLFNYVENRPVRLVDPRGLCAPDPRSHYVRNDPRDKTGKKKLTVQERMGNGGLRFTDENGYDVFVDENGNYTFTKDRTTCPIGSPCATGSDGSPGSGGNYYGK